ncbi:MAG: leucine--tRNA ligase [Patescibacteria group bacterium]
MFYDPGKIEPKWQAYWDKHKVFKPVDFDTARKKLYHLVMFAYPSGDLHMGHWYNFAPADTYARFKVMQGMNVLSPFGFDAFGLPAENAAILNKLDPAIWTKDNIARMRRQLKSMGPIYDWDREVATNDPGYYKWTQWLFLQLYKKGLAYKTKALANWCPSCQTVLANEQVVAGHCERCETEVVQKEIEQWLFKITEYADRLLKDLDNLDWPERTKTAQRNWIGKSEGLLFSAPVKDTEIVIETFSAHFQACYADTFVVIAPDHPLLAQLVAGVPNKKEVLDFAQNLLQQRKAAGFVEEKEVSGIFTGRYIVDPLGNGELPIWVASYAIKEYGTGIVKCSAHDERDFRFAKKYSIPLKVVLVPEDQALRTKVENFEICYTDMKNGILTEPKELAGQKAGNATQAVIHHLEERGWAKRTTKYRLRDWLVSRQRYWGPPIPILYCNKCGIQAVPENELPVELPKIKDYLPKGKSPLATAPKAWLETTCPNCNGSATREVETMDTFVDSSWYFLRYADSKNTKRFADAKLIKYWCPVDIYIGGAEHTVLHLLYARFITKVMKDLRYIEFDEPFTKLRHQGIILGPDHQKMSKSRGNVIDPDEIVKKYGSDTVRMFLMFMGPYDQGGPWSPAGIGGIFRFLKRVASLSDNTIAWQATHMTSHMSSHMTEQTLDKVTQDLEQLHFNTAIAALMTLLNHFEKYQPVPTATYQKFLLILAPFAPHLAEELWNKLGEKQSIFKTLWPKADISQLKSEQVLYIVQINGKVRAKITLATGTPESEVIKQAWTNEKITPLIQGKKILKTIHVPSRLINFVVE